MGYTRKSISKTARFEVFKRDGFQCVYCGATPPKAFLQVDHIIAVANGGGNEVENLTTSCEDCNQGKGARHLSDIPQSLSDRSDEIAEREGQLAGYRDVVNQRKARLEGDIDVINNVFESWNPGWELSDMARRSIGRFLRSLDVDEIIEAIDIAYDKGLGWKYFCGICWKKIRDQGADHA